MLNLVRNITVHGPDPFGRPSQFHLYPNASKGVLHWTIRSNSGTQTRTVTSDLLRYATRTVRLTKGSVDLPVAEHILPLAWFVAGVHIIQLSAYPPYIMPGELLKSSGPHSIRSACEVSKPRDWDSIIAGAEWEYPKPRGGTRAYTRVLPHKKKTLEVFVSIDYPGVGHFEKTYDLESMTEAEAIRILSTHTQMVVPFPALTKRLLSFAQWPFMNHVVWPDVSSEAARQKTLEAWANHRFLDILGTFGVLVDGYDCPSMRIESVNSGHMADVNVARRVLIRRVVS
jgi:hypothetical protein